MWEVKSLGSWAPYHSKTRNFSLIVMVSYCERVLMRNNVFVVGRTIYAEWLTEDEFIIFREISRDTNHE